jgi:hypothetical protein
MIVEVQGWGHAGAAQARLKTDNRSEFVRPFNGQFDGELATHGASHIHGSFKTESTDQLDLEIHEKPLGQLVFLLPPFNGFRWQGLAVIGEIGNDDLKFSRDLFVVQQVAPEPPVGCRCVLANKRNAGSVLLEVDAVFDAVNLEIDVSADRWVEFSHC